MLLLMLYTLKSMSCFFYYCTHFFIYYTDIWKFVESCICRLYIISELWDWEEYSSDEFKMIFALLKLLRWNLAWHEAYYIYKISQTRVTTQLGFYPAPKTFLKSNKNQIHSIFRPEEADENKRNVPEYMLQILIFKYLLIVMNFFQY